MLNLSQKQLAKRAGISVATLNNIERGAHTDPRVSTLRAIEGALQEKGIIFTTDPLGGVGISLKPNKLQTAIKTILIVDDDRADRTLYKTWLSDGGYNVVEAGNARDGYDAFVAHKPDVMVLDFMMYGADGFQLLATLRHERIALPAIIFVTGMLNETLEESAHAQGVHACLSKKNLKRDQFRAAVARAISMRSH